MSQNNSSPGIVGYVGSGNVAIGSTVSPFVIQSSTGLTFNTSTNTLTVTNLTLTNPLTVPNGGTGAATLTGVLIGNGTGTVTGNAVTQFDVLVGGASNAITSISPSTAGFILTSNGVSANPTFQAMSTTGLVTSVSGGNNITITGTASAPIVNVSGTTNHAVQIGNSTTSLTSIAVGATGQGLMGATAADPAWTGSPSFSGTVTAGTGLTVTTGTSNLNGNVYMKGITPWADVVAFGADPTGVADSTTAINNAIQSLANTINGGVVFFPVGGYKISSTILVNLHAITLQGVGSSSSDDVAATQMGSFLSWAGPSTTTASIMVKVQPPSTGSSAPGNKCFRFNGLSLFGNGTALIGLQMISCQSFNIQDFYIQDTSYVAIDMNVLNDSQTDAGERDTTRGLIIRGNLRLLDGQLSTATSTLANNTNIGAFAGAGVITTSTTITSGSSNGQFPTSGVLLLWVLDPNGHYQQAAVAYTSLTTGASGSFNGCTSLGMLTNTAGFSPLGSLTPTLNSSTLGGLTTLQLAQGPASMGLRLDGAPNFDVAYVDFEQIQINSANSVAVSNYNSDDNYFYDCIVNRSASATLTPPGFTFHGSTVSANSCSRNNTLYGGSAGAGGAVVYGTAQGSISTTQNNYGAITYTNPSLDIYWRDYGMANGEQLPGIGQFAWLWYNNNSTQFGAPTNTLLGNSRNAGISTTTAASGAINTGETVINASTPVPFNSMQVGTHYRITALGTCTATVANASTFTIRFGTAGTTGDASIATAVSQNSAAAGTGIPFKVVVDFTVRTTGGTGTIAGSLVLSNTPPAAATVATALTGISVIPQQIIALTATATMNTTVSSFITITYKTAATTTTSTFQNVIVEVIKA